jgi:FKBP-type peptidyl-prolyl cis-trans isomerase
MRRKLSVGIGGAFLFLTVAACTPRSSEPVAVAGHFGVDAGAQERADFERVLARAAAEPGAVQTRSGMVYRELVAGRGAAPSGNDTVTLRYQVKTESGEAVADSSSSRAAVTVVLDQIGDCEREALERMRAGGTSRFVCPLPRPRDVRGNASRRAPLFIEVTLIDVGLPLPAPGH